MRSPIFASILVGLFVACSGDNSESPPSSLADAGEQTSTDVGATQPEPRPPQFDGPASITIAEGGVATATLLATDPDGTAVAFSVASVSEGYGAVIDGLSVDVRAPYGAQPGRLVLTLTDEDGATATGTVTLQATAARWVDRLVWSDSAGPEAREHPAVWVDAPRNRAVLLQGTGYQPQFEQMLDDAWAFDLESQQWRALSVTGAVPGAGSRRLAGAAAPDEVVLFGGYGPPPVRYDDLLRATLSADEVRFETITIASATRPSARSLHVFAYDPQTDRYVLFGGVDTGILGDTWTMRINDQGAAEWTEHTLSPSPSPRYGTFFAFDEATGRLIVYSGGQTAVAGDPVNAADDAWALDLRADPIAWTRLSDGTEAGAPSGRRNGAAAWDASAQRLFIFGGTDDARTTQPGLWVFDARPEPMTDSRWQLLEPPAPPDLFAPPPRSSGAGFFAVGRAYFGFGNDQVAFADWGVLGF